MPLPQRAGTDGYDDELMDIDFPWQTLRAVVGGDSAIDLTRLQTDTVERATAFLASYGYDWANASERRELDGLRREAIAFLAHLIGDLPGLELPVELHQLDTRALLLAVATDDRLRPWCCALLRAMHVLNHAETYFSVRYQGAIHDQIVGRFTSHIVEGHAGMTLGSGLTAIPLDAFEVKHAKTKWSTAIKLLHKEENVAAEVFDRIGVRLITQGRFDALRVVRYLRTEDVINFANVNPARSYNSLIDLDAVQDEAARIYSVLADASEEERLAAMQEFVEGQRLPTSEATPRNPFSSIGYHAIQFTCRQRIRVSLEHERVRFFFPFEVQVLDRKAMAEARVGLASHDAYKARQRRQAQLRVLGPTLLELRT